MEFVIPPPPPGDPRRRLRFREAAVEWLRSMHTFASVSRRLITDLTDVAEHHDLRAAPPGDSFRIAGIALLVVLEGEVVVERTAAPGAPPGPLFILAHHRPPREAEAPPPPLRVHLRPGVYVGSDERWMKETSLRIRTAGKEGAYVIVVSRKEMARWLRASPTLLHSIGFREGHQVLITTEELWGEARE